MNTPYTSSQIATILLAGAVGGALSVLIAHLARRHTRAILATVLIGAAAFYILFAARAGAGTAWIVAEVIGVSIYGGMGIAGVRGSLWWMAAGWALHPVWDMGLHYFGPGHAFAPEPYAIACLSWDWLTTAYIVYRAMRESPVGFGTALDGGTSR
jgi:hypothetical protein